MDVRMLVERIRLLGAANDAEALRRLVNSPDARIIAKAWLAAQMDDPEGVCRWAQKIGVRDPREIGLHETELDAEAVGYLAQLGIETIGQAERRSDAELLRHKHVDAFRLEELRAIVAKYLGKPKSQYMEPARRERVEKRVLERLARGDHPGDIAEELRLDVTLVREIAAQTLTEQPPRVRRTRKPA